MVRVIITRHPTKKRNIPLRKGALKCENLPLLYRIKGYLQLLLELRGCFGHGICLLMISIKHQNDQVRNYPSSSVRGPHYGRRALCYSILYHDFPVLTSEANYHAEWAGDFSDAGEGILHSAQVIDPIVFIVYTC
jgi:hypothetical protein